MRNLLAIAKEVVKPTPQAQPLLDPEDYFADVPVHAGPMAPDNDDRVHAPSASERPA